MDAALITSGGTQRAGDEATIRQLLAAGTPFWLDLHGSAKETLPILRDVYDHLIRISDLVDSYRDVLSGMLDTHLSTVSNRLNVVMKELTIIATLFLPLSFLRGFFGQNFDFLMSHISGLPAFLIFGVGLELAAVVGPGDDVLAPRLAHGHNKGDPSGVAF